MKLTKGEEDDRGCAEFGASGFREEYREEVRDLCFSPRFAGAI